jgi:TldD protein
MQDKLKNYISKIEADYADIRYEMMNKSTVSFSGKELKTIGSNSTDGYVIRVLKDGGFSNIAVTKESDIERAIQIVTDNASLLGKESDKKTELKLPDVVQEEVKLELNEDPREISLDEKLKLTSHYNDLMLNSKDIETTTASYQEVNREKYFVSSKGTYIHEPTLTNFVVGRIVAKSGELVQNIRADAGGSDGFARLRDRDDRFLEKAKIASELLRAEPVKGGNYNLVMDPQMTGTFVHEAFGHFSEADLVENNPSILGKMEIGAKLGTDILSITDDPTQKGLVGYYKYDDEGVLARPVKLMDKGVLTGRLHSMKTAAAFGDELTGHTVAEDFRYAPIIRMGTIGIEAGKDSFEEVLKKAGNGLYAIGCKGGQTSGENFTFAALYGYLIQDGKLGPLVRDINVMGNLFTSMKNVAAISQKVEYCELGGCGKGQHNMKSCMGGPHVLINDALVGGV